MPMNEDDGNPVTSQFSASTDPTALTRAMLLREISNLRERLEIKIDGEVITRIEAMDKAMILFQENLTRVPTEVQKEVGHLRELHSQKFEDVAGQLREQGRRREADKQAAEMALAAALQSQKELSTTQDNANAAALAKAQEGTDKQIEGIGATITLGFKSLDDKIAIINQRLDRGEGGAGASTRADDRMDARQRDVATSRLAHISITVSIVISVISLLSVVIAGTMAIRSSSPPQAVYQVPGPVAIPSPTR